MVFIKSEDSYRALPAECYEIKARMDRRRDIVRRELTALALDRRRLNRLRPVAKLDRHTLTKIFTMVMGPLGDGRQYGMPETIAFKPYHWLYITHVCHRWRTVALETTEFWTQLYFAKPEWIEQLLTRSKDAPLKFSFMIPPIPNRACAPEFTQVALNRMTSLKLSLDQVSRAERIHLELPKIFMNRVQERTQGNNLPQLRRLVLINTSDTHAGPKRPFPFADCDLPSLTHLAMWAYEDHWKDRLIVSTLTHITLCGYTYQSCDTTLQTVLEVLSSLHRLTRLNLQNALKPLEDQSDASTSSPGPPKVRLPELRDLIIEGRSIVVRPFLCHLHVPPRCRVILRITATELSEVAAVTSAVTELYERSGVLDAMSHFTGLAVRVGKMMYGNEADEPVIECYTADAPLRDRFWEYRKDVKPCCEIRIIADYPQDPFADTIDVIQAICRSLRLLNIKELHLGQLAGTNWRYEGPTAPYSNMISEILEGTAPTGIEYLSVGPCAFMFLPYMLNPLCEVKTFESEPTWDEHSEADLSQHSSPNFRNLKAISFHHCCIISKTTWNWSEIARKLLNKALRCRSKDAFSFAEFSLNGCSCCTPTYAYARDLLTAMEDMCSRQGKFTLMLIERSQEDEAWLGLNDYVWNDETMVLEGFPVEEPHDWLRDLRQNRRVTFNFHAEQQSGLTIEEVPLEEGIIQDPAKGANSPFP